MVRSVVGVEVKDVEKRRYPSKHYVYVIYVTWSDGTVSVIYRRYSKFFNLQCKLLNTFPKDGGTEDPTSRTIPFIPGKIFLGRSHIQKVALKRSGALDTYLKALIKLPDYLSQSQLVLGFFETTQADLKPDTYSEGDSQSASVISEPVPLEQYVAIADYSKERANEVDLTQGMLVDVYDKKESGWWFVSTEVSQGWVPGSYLQRTDGIDEELAQEIDNNGETYVCSKEYSASQSDEVSLVKGASVLVIQKSLDGWWKVRHNNMEGWAPAACLVKPGSAQAERLRLADPGVTAYSGSGKTAIKTPTVIQPRGKPVPPRANSIERPKACPPRPAPPSFKKEYITLADFTDTAGDGISFKQGQYVKVLEKSGTGWWFVEIDNDQGWAPSSYIQEKKPSRPPPPTQTKQSIAAAPSIGTNTTATKAWSPKTQPPTQTKQSIAAAPSIGTNTTATKAWSPKTQPMQGQPSGVVKTGNKPVPPSRPTRPEAPKQSVNENSSKLTNAAAGDSEEVRPTVSQLRKKLEQSKVS